MLPYIRAFMCKPLFIYLWNIGRRTKQDSLLDVDVSFSIYIEKASNVEVSPCQWIIKIVDVKIVHAPLKILYLKLQHLSWHYKFNSEFLLELIYCQAIILYAKYRKGVRKYSPNKLRNGNS